MSATRKAVLHLKPGFPATLTPADVENIRRMVIEGRTAKEIAAVFATGVRDVENYLRDRKWRWTNLHNEGRIEFLPEKTVIYRHRSRKDGGFDIRPFSVPAISMHRAELEARL